MGILNTATKEIIPNAASITVMTMTTVTISTHLSKVCIYASMVAWERDEASEEERSKLKESWAALIKAASPLFYFCIGAIVGAAAMHYLAFFSLLLPAGLLLLIIIDILAREHSQYEHSIQEVENVTAVEMVA